MRLCTKLPRFRLHALLWAMVVVALTSAIWRSSMTNAVPLFLISTHLLFATLAATFFAKIVSPRS